MKKKTLLAVLALLASVSFCFACGSEEDTRDRDREEVEEEEKEEEEEDAEEKPVVEKPSADKDNEKPAEEEGQAQEEREHHMLYADDENLQPTVEVLEVYNPDHFVPEEDHDWIYVDKNDREKEAFIVGANYSDTMNNRTERGYETHEIGTTSQGWSIIKQCGEYNDTYVCILCGHIEGSCEKYGDLDIIDIHFKKANTDFDDWTDEDYLHLVLQLLGEE